MRLLIQHLVGVSGQVGAALPLLLITVFLSRTAGLVAAGRFSVIAGVSAAAFSVALWGLRTLVVLDAFKKWSAWDLLYARLAALLVAAVVTVAAAMLLSLEWYLLAAIIGYRASDAVIDLGFAFNQVWTDTHGALCLFAAQHGLKLMVLIGAAAVAAAAQPALLGLSLSLSGICLFALFTVVIVRQIRRRSGPAAALDPIRLVDVFREAGWFAAAAGVCSVVTGAPRIALPLLTSGETLGVIGVSLSASTIFGMCFYTTWVRMMPTFRAAPNRRVVAAIFMGENAVMAIALGLSSWFLFPAAIDWIFELQTAGQVELARGVLVASVVFFWGMNCANLYKITSKPWRESFVYAAALLATVAIALLIAEFRDTVSLLLICGVLMGIGGTTALIAIGMSTDSEEAELL